MKKKHLNKEKAYQPFKIISMTELQNLVHSFLKPKPNFLKGHIKETYLL